MTITVKQAENDFKYLYNNLPYASDEYIIISKLWDKILFKKLKRVDLLIWSIKDALSNNKYSNYTDKELEWIATDERVQEIREQYNIKEKEEVEFKLYSHNNKLLKEVKALSYSEARQEFQKKFSGKYIMEFDGIRKNVRFY